MDPRDDYAEFGPPPPLADPRWWHHVGRNLLLAAGLLGFGLSVAGVVVAAIVEKRSQPQPRLPVLEMPDSISE